MPTRPQDRRPRKATKFTYTAKGGRQFTLPLASRGVSRVSGRVLRDAAVKGEEGQLALGFELLEACGADQATIDAIYDLPGPECLDLIGNWLAFGDGDGATLPESSRSST